MGPAHCVSIQSGPCGALLLLGRAVPVDSCRVLGEQKLPQLDQNGILLQNMSRSVFLKAFTWQNILRWLGSAAEPWMPLPALSCCFLGLARGPVALAHVVTSKPGLLSEMITDKTFFFSSAALTISGKD